jgi:hypothetical protein
MTADLGVGFLTSLSLIVAIGAQNAFVLRQGLRREHVVQVALVCGLSDAALIGAGIAGLGVVITGNPTALAVVRYGGAAFLLAFAVIAARRSLRPGALTPAQRDPSDEPRPSSPAWGSPSSTRTSTSTPSSCWVPWRTSAATGGGSSASVPSPPASPGSSRWRSVPDAWHPSSRAHGPGASWTR